MEDNYLIVREYEERIKDSKSGKYPEFISFKHENGSFYFAWIKHGRVFLRSEGYDNAPARDNNMLSVIKNCGDENNYRTTSAHGAYFLYLVSGSNKEIARSYPMREEIETFIALRLINKVDANASKTTLEVSSHAEDKDTTSFETAIVQEVHELEEIIDNENPLTSDSIETIMPQKEPNVSELEEVKTPIHEEMAKKIMSSPLLESFQKEINNTEAPPMAMPEEVSKTEIDEELPLPISIEETEVNNSEHNIESLVTDTIDEDNAAEQAIVLKEAADYLYSEMKKNEKKTKLGTILDEENKEANKGGLRWILWLIIIGLLAALLWWLFQMKGYKTIEKIMNKNRAIYSAAIIKKDVFKKT